MQEAYYEAYRHTATVHEVGEVGRLVLNHLAAHGRSTKRDLCAALILGDRRLRKEVELLRRAGVPVLSSSGHGAGYWLSTSIDEIEGFIDHELASRRASLDEQSSRLRATVGAVRRRLSP